MTPAPTSRPAPGGDSTAAAARPDLEGLALELLQGTQAAALACVPWVGRGDRKAADRAAVAAMRTSFAGLSRPTTVVIGEGEKDRAPMLHVGERLGTGGPPEVDLAVDPLEGTNFCATGHEGAISIVAAAPAGSLWAAPAYYMDKVVVGPAAAGVVDIEAPTAEKLAAIARADGRRVEDLVAVILAKPRHVELIAEVRRLGARVVEVADGDIAGALRVVLPGGDADVLLGVGGAPEGVITACAVRLLGGDMVARLAPQSEAEAARLRADGADLDEVLSLDRLATSDRCVVAATGVTGGILDGVRRTATGRTTESLLVTPRHRGLVVRALHRAEREIVGRRAAAAVPTGRGLEAATAGG